MPLARHVSAARKPAMAAEQLADEILGCILNEALRATQMSSRSDYSVTYRRRVADEHQDIIDALRAGNASLACERMRTHVHTSAHSWAGAARVAGATARN